MSVNRVILVGHLGADRDGIERYQTEVVGERMQMLGGRDDSKLTVLRRAFELARNNVRY